MPLVLIVDNDGDTRELHDAYLATPDVIPSRHGERDARRATIRHGRGMRSVQRLTRGLRSPENDVPLLRVLVVDDDPVQREIAVELLGTLGCRVEVATDGAGAVRNTSTLRPDLILMDLGMPTIDGWAAIRRIRRLAEPPPPHIIVLSALADARARQLAFEAGCNEYLVKPADVRGAVTAYVARTGHRRLGSG
jgi:CheY-like chemotaxis protein